jgi:hypothetical protein
LPPDDASCPEAVDLEAAMTAIARAVSRAFQSATTDIDVLKELALLCGAGLLVSLLLLTYGLDLSPGFF